MEASHFYCPQHPNRKVALTCFDTNCKKKSVFCSKCIGIHYNSCNKEFVISHEEIKDFVEVNNQRTNPEEVEQILDQIVQENSIYFKNKLLEVKKKIMEVFIERNTSNLKRLSDVEPIKHCCNIELDSVRDKIKITPKANAFELAYINNKLKKFNTDIKDCMNDFIGRMKSFCPFGNEINEDSWISNKSVRIDQDDEETIIMGTNDTYFPSNSVALNCYPLTTKTKFKVTIRSIRKDNRYLPFGIIDQRVFDMSKGDCILRRMGDVIYFGGFEHKGQLNGKIITEDRTDKNGFCAGKEFFMEYHPQKEIRFYDKYRKIDLVRSMVEKEGPYYMIVIPYLGENSCIVKRLKFD